MIKSTDISLDRQTSSASVIWFEKLSRDHQLSWRKLQKIIILNFILYIIQVYCTLIYKHIIYTNKFKNIVKIIKLKKNMKTSFIGTILALPYDWKRNLTLKEVSDFESLFVITVIFQLYHAENKLICNEMMMIALY